MLPSSGLTSGLAHSPIGEDKLRFRVPALVVWEGEKCTGNQNTISQIRYPKLTKIQWTNQRKLVKWSSHIQDLKFLLTNNSQKGIGKNQKASEARTFNPPGSSPRVGRLNRQPAFSRENVLHAGTRLQLSRTFPPMINNIFLNLHKLFLLFIGKLDALVKVRGPETWDGQTQHAADFREQNRQRSCYILVQQCWRS